MHQRTFFLSSGLFPLVVSLHHGCLGGWTTFQHFDAVASGSLLPSGKSLVETVASGHGEAETERSGHAWLWLLLQCLSFFAVVLNRKVAAASFRESWILYFNPSSDDALGDVRVRKGPWVSKQPRHPALKSCLVVHHSVQKTQGEAWVLWEL